MNSTFDINRVGLLLKRYFIENKQLELTFWIIATVVFMIFHRTDFAGLFLGISGLIFAANSFKAFGITPNGIHYLLIPATHAEKLIATIVINTFYFFTAFLITYIIGTSLGTTIYNFVMGAENPLNFRFFYEHSNHLNITTNALGTGDFKLLRTFIAFAGTQSVFMLGSIYFKRSAAAKTLLVLFGFAIVLIIIEVFLVKITFGTYSINKSMINLSINAENLFSGFSVVGKIFAYLLIPFFWTVTYFRLTEKQV